MDILFRPILTWPGKLSTARRGSQFKASYNDTLKLLDVELGRLRASNVVIQLALDPRDIRLDGMPRADARPAHPGVILAFDSKHGPLSYPCDTFSTWQENLRAIALALEYLRAVDRYGVTKRGEQYRGWTALPAPAKGCFASKDDAALWVSRETGSGVSVDTIINHEEARQQAFRALAFRLHPDRGGDPEKFKKLQAAKEALEG